MNETSLTYCGTVTCYKFGAAFYTLVRGHAIGFSRDCKALVLLNKIFLANNTAI